MINIVLIIIRMGIALFPSFSVDMDAWMAWSYRLAELGFNHFYSSSMWTQYTPGYLYWLWVVGNLGWAHPWIIKLPTIVADLITAKLIIKIVGGSKRIKQCLTIAYVLSPVILWDGAVWGQIDGILTMFMLASVYFLSEKQNWWMSWVSLAVALLIKPQAVAILPIIVILTVAKFGWGQLLIGASLTGLIQIAGYAPFFPNDPWGGMVMLLQQMSVSYPYTSLFAYNVWAWIGMWQNDTTIWFGKSYAFWGVISSGLAMLIIILKSIKNNLFNKLTIFWLSMMACWIFYLFPTRVHERYLFPMFAFAMVVIGLGKKMIWSWLLIITTIIYWLNLYMPYSYYEPQTNWLVNQTVESFIASKSYLWSTLLVAIWVAWLYLFPAGKDSKIMIPKISRKKNVIEHGENKN